MGVLACQNFIEELAEKLAESGLNDEVGGEETTVSEEVDEMR